ncbi:TetR/AcrR family transcriptional regulator [Kribbella sp. NPDC051620]|uniref:TetR/AcrR family transcriptional regulator n=1 Tax=Kribbella sp. NPDC051620 TaxID=3364120 RepID=UPI00378FBD10
MSEPASKSAGRRRGPRRDALDNRDRVLAAAIIAVRREGAAVPMATIAADAGVGVGTVYRHFPSRDALLAALAHRSAEMVLDAARSAAADDRPPLDAIRAFLYQTIRDGKEIVLPMQSGQPLTDPATKAVMADVHRILDSLISQGRADGTIRADISKADVVVFGAMLTQQLPQTGNWTQVARRLADIFIAGLQP